MQRVKVKDNSNPIIKVALREWVVEQLGEPIRVLDAYGGNGEMFKQVWSKKATLYNKTEGDAVQWLKGNNLLGYNVFDVDPYGSPFEALLAIAEKTKNKVAIVCTDGALMRGAMMSLVIPKCIVKLMGWNENDYARGNKNSRAQKADIYYHYGGYLKVILTRIFEGYDVQLATKRSAAKINGTWATMYFAAILTPRAGRA